MYQQINFYQPVFRQQHKIFSAVTLLQILAAVMVFLLGFYGQARWQLAGLERTADLLEVQHQQLEASLGRLESAAPSPEQAALEAEIAQLQRTVLERRELLSRFDRLPVGSSPEFGQFFEALARHSLRGLWLTGVRLTQDGQTELRGATLNPKLVPRYLQQLPDQPRFRSLNRGFVHLARPEPGSTAIEFVVIGRQPGKLQ